MIVSALTVTSLSDRLVTGTNTSFFVTWTKHLGTSRLVSLLKVSRPSSSPSVFSPKLAWRRDPLTNASHLGGTMTVSHTCTLAHVFTASLFSWTTCVPICIVPCAKSNRQPCFCMKSVPRIPAEFPMSPTTTLCRKVWSPIPNSKVVSPRMSKFCPLAVQRLSLLSLSTARVSLSAVSNAAALRTVAADPLSTKNSTTPALILTGTT